MERDFFDEIVERWVQQKPDAEMSGYEIIGRILLLAKQLQDGASRRLAPLGLDLPAFEVLVTLWAQGPPYHVSPTELCRAAMLSSGAMTNRLDRLEASGLLARRPDPDDRRGLIIELTPEGKDLTDRAVAARLEEAGEAIAPLPGSERLELRRLLRKLLAPREDTPLPEREGS